MSHIINKLTITPNSLKLEFSNDLKDPFVHIAEISGMRDESLQSHIDAIAERVISEKMDSYEEDKNQLSMFDDDGEAKAHKAAEEDPTNFADPDGEAEEEDYSMMAVPLINGTQMPSFKNMLTEHAAWYIHNHYTGEDGEPGIGDLIQDIKHSLDAVIDDNLNLSDAKLVAIDYLQF